ncbi:MAG TPA: dihydropteroate synthase, partial [Sphingomonadales bacterium]
VWALRRPGAREAVAAHPSCGICLMHMHLDPQTMQTAPMAGDVLPAVRSFLEREAQRLEALGVAPARIVLDPGIGFGKTLEHNLALLGGLALFHGLGCPILLGVSRKSFIGRITGIADPAARLPGSLAVAVEAARQGVQIIRVHDVAETVQALAVAAALRGDR